MNNQQDKQEYDYFWEIDYDSPRRIIKSRAILDRIRIFGRVRNSCPCDLCGTAVATDLHEIVSRNRTMHSDEERSMTFVRPITALLCQPCHEKAGSPMNQDRLFKRLFKIYGRFAVKLAFERLPANIRAGIAFPEEE